MCSSVRLWAVVWSLVAACGGSTPENVRLRLRLESRDTHLLDVAAVEVNLTRDNVTVRERIEAGSGRTLTFPIEAVVAVPIADGALRGEAIARDAAGGELGSGEGAASATSGQIAALTIELFSVRSGRPARGRTGTPSGGPEPDGGAQDATGAPMLADAAVDAGARPGDAAAEGAADTLADRTVDAAAGDAAPSDGGACQERLHRLVARAVVSVDYGPPPRDPRDTRVGVAAGFDHGHIHEYIGWMRFDLSGVGEHATLRAMRVSLELEVRSSMPPRLGILYSASDAWSPLTVASDTAEMIARTARVSGDLGIPQPRRTEYAVEVPRYQPFWTADLADNAVTLGMMSTTPPEAPETWAYFHGLAVPALAPMLELTTCE